jgi:hypothetical protein
MPRPDPKTQLEALHRQQIELGRKVKEAEAEARRKEREKDERRKLLAGALALAEIAVRPDSPIAGQKSARRGGSSGASDRRGGVRTARAPPLQSNFDRYRAVN